VAADAPRDGLLKAIGSLFQGFWDIVPLGNAFWHIREGDHKSSVLGIWHEESWVEKGSHNGLLCP
jgi:hypothetical protein